MLRRVKFGLNFQALPLSVCLSILEQSAVALLSPSIQLFQIEFVSHPSFCPSYCSAAFRYPYLPSAQQCGIPSRYSTNTQNVKDTQNAQSFSAFPSVDSKSARAHRVAVSRDQESGPMRYLPRLHPRAEVVPDHKGPISFNFVLAKLPNLDSCTGLVQ
ncbi:hypothetical protein B0H66DRAFT_552903 [Apodospora peruviana]|uniref:Uncharacterized protein n=1 Tax=Apodospora peruviana TaxID=516989 RepID=A0AAE0IBE9_9PEZI|nr:hypothetical protein B0H66DRAFT_552903 [Apodospora peruviana]